VEQIPSKIPKLNMIVLEDRNINNDNNIVGTQFSLFNKFLPDISLQIANLPPVSKNKKKKKKKKKRERER
jgi:hypothetical protein